MDEKMRVISTEEELKVFNDPYRMKIIRVYQQHRKPLTVKGCADIMGEVPAKVHYHVKKLLKINILELDHIEVVNGINAKFYKLPQTQFTISIKEDDDTSALKRLGQVHTILSNILDDFKDELMKNSSYAIEQKEPNQADTGFLSSNQIYLNDEELKELTEFFTNLSDKYSEKSEDRNTYTFVGGLARVREDKN